MDQRCRNYYNDDPRDMLLARRIARYLSKYNWYYPQHNGNGIRPSLDEAWEFFEHVTLSRYVVEDEEGESASERENLLEKAIPGENNKKTKLYPIFGREKDLKQFGPGVATYFRTLNTLTVVSLIAFAINIPLTIFYESPAYSPSAKDDPLYVRGSAVCRSQVWKPCPTCVAQDFSEDRFATVNNDESNQDLTFALVNDCQIESNVIFSNWFACIFVIISYLFLQRYYRRYAVMIDEEIATSSDYTVCIDNPPGDASDAEEWKSFFSDVCETGDVVFCTIACHNDELVDALMKRKQYMLKFERMLPPEIPMDEWNLKDKVDQLPPIPWWRKPFSTSAESLFEKIQEVEREIFEMTKKNYSVTQVFITFNREKTQRKVLREFSTSGSNIVNQRTSAFPSKYLFRGKHVLHVKRPVEPSAILWEQTNRSLVIQIMVQIAFAILAILLIAAGGFIVYICQNYTSGIFLGLTATSISISVLNTISPRAMLFFAKYENHGTEGDKQKSIFFKLVLFRLANTAVILYIITPFVNTLTATELIISLWSIFYTEMLTAPVTFLSDYKGHYERHILAPRATTQRQMNLHFGGAPYLLAERFTDMTKIIFAAFFYAAIFPLGFLFAAVCLHIHSVVARICILRSWQKMPDLGTILPRFANQFGGFVIIVFTYMGCFMWSGFPYDNCCEYVGDDKTRIILDYLGNHIITALDGTTQNVTVTADDKAFKYCAQNIPFKLSSVLSMLRFEDNKEWMSQKQIEITGLYAWTFVVVLGAELFRIAFIFFKKFWKFYVSDVEKQEGRPITRHFWAFPEIPAYIPKVHVNGYALPFILCDLKDVDLRFMSRKARDGNYKKQSFFQDIMKIRENFGLQNDDRKVSMDIVKCWSPELSLYE